MSQLLGYRDLILYLVARDLKVRYRRSVIGALWTMLQPLLTMAVLMAVFSSIFRFKIDNFAVYALSGILFWNFFSQSIVSSMNSLSGNAPILKLLPVPTMVFPVATILSGVVNVGLALVPLGLILLVTGHPLSPALFFLPIAILLSAAFTLGVGLLLSPLSVFFADVTELVGVMLMMLMYLTPIFYPMEIVPEKLRWVVRFNPVRSILEVFRDPIYHGKIPPLSHFSVALVVAVLSLCVGYVVFQRSSRRIPYYV